MFTGIIEDIGRVENIRRSKGGLNITIKTSLEDIKEGDSVSKYKKKQRWIKYHNQNIP